MFVEKSKFDVQTFKRLLKVISLWTLESVLLFDSLTTQYILLLSFLSIVVQTKEDVDQRVANLNIKIYTFCLCAKP